MRELIATLASLIICDASVEEENVGLGLVIVHLLID